MHIDSNSTEFNRPYRPASLRTLFCLLSLHLGIWASQSRKVYVHIYPEGISSSALPLNLKLELRKCRQYFVLWQTFEMKKNCIFISSGRRTNDQMCFVLCNKVCCLFSREGHVKEMLFKAKYSYKSLNLSGGLFFSEKLLRRKSCNDP